MPKGETDGISDSPRDPDSETTIPYGMNNQEAAAAGAEALRSAKRKRGTCKTKVTNSTTRIRSSFDVKEKNVDVINSYLEKLHGDFSAFAESHSACHLLVPEEEQEASARYFTEVQEEYQACCEEAAAWLKRVEGTHPSGHRDNSLSTEQVPLLTPSPKRAVKELRSEVKTLSHELCEMKTLLAQAVAALQAAGGAPQPVGAASDPPTRAGDTEEPKLHPAPTAPPVVTRPTSSPTRSVPPRVSFGGNSYLAYAPDTSQAPDWVGDLTTTLRSIASDSQSRRKEDAYEGPKVKLPTFSGEEIEYWTFMRAFESQVEGGTQDPRRRLSALLHYTSGEANEIIQNCTTYPPEEGYLKAKELLKEHFGNSESAAQAWLAKLRQSAAVSDVKGLRKFYFLLKRCQDTLQMMDQLEVFQSPSNLCVIIDKLPYNLKEKWQTRNLAIKKGKKRPILADVVEFVHDTYLEKSDPFFGGPLEEKRASRPIDRTKPGPRRECYAVEDTERGLPMDTARSPSPPMYVNSQRAQLPPCVVCGGAHPLYRCTKFKELSSQSRFQVVKSHNLCRNCLSVGHRAVSCRSKFTCHICKGKHHSLVHDVFKSVSEDVSVEPESVAPDAGSDHVVANVVTEAKIALPIVPLIIVNGNRSRLSYALLDTGSTCTLFTRQLVTDLGLETVPCNANIVTLGDTPNPVVEKIPMVEVSSVISGETYTMVDVLVRDQLNISLQCMARRVDITRWPHLQGIDLHNESPGKVEVLIGQNNVQFLTSISTKRGPRPGDPKAELTVLGWYISGPLGTPRASGGLGEEVDNHLCNNLLAEDRILHEQVARFWRINGLYDVTDEPQMSVTDKRVLKFWEENVQMEEGHYVLPIPFKERPINVENNEADALKKMKSLEYRLKKSTPEVQTAYVGKMQENITERYAERVPDHELKGRPGKVRYIPHQIVFHPRKKDPRVVFNCASKYKGKSLNDYIHAGPDLLNKLLVVLLLFRQDLWAFICDIRRMFNNVWVVIEDRDCLRFFWWEDGIIGGKLVVYRMRTHLFGGVWSPSVVMFALRRVCQDFGKNFDDETLSTIMKNFYMDDCAKARSTTEQMVRMMGQLREILMMANFPLLKFLSNNVEALKQLPEELRAKGAEDEVLDLGSLPHDVLLGCGWNPETDNLSVRIVMPPKPRTKRELLSAVSSIFDPMGLLGPVVLRAKLIFQDTHRIGLGWDDPLPEKHQAEFAKWSSEIKILEQVSFPRCILPPGISLKVESVQNDLHIFSDSSEKAYGSASYVKSECLGAKSVNLLLAKGRLCPLKPLSIPRLELVAAHLSVQIANFLLQNLEITITRVFFWTDSSIVLFYIYTETGRQQTFVANRVGYIREFTVPKQWKHVPTDQNPADLISRTCSPQDFAESSLWRNGPAFLLGPESEWPNTPLPLPVQTEDLELKAEARAELRARAGESVNAAQRADVPLEVAQTLVFSTQKKASADPESSIERMLARCGLWYEMRKRTAWLMKYVRHLQGEKVEKYITLAELEAAGDKIMAFVQKRHLSKVKNTHEYRSLAPYRDGDLVKVGGRMDQTTLPEGVKHPPILPPHHVTKAIVLEVHLRTGHGGRERVLSEVIRVVWIIGARNFIRGVKAGCMWCRRMTGRMGEQRMSSLIPERALAEEAPFASTGVDYFGPIYVVLARSERKRYGVLFTCYSSRAIHLEVAESLSADDCINAYVRFTTRRGVPRLMNSDNGTNLVGAEKEMSRAIEEWNVGKVRDEMLRRGCEWRFTTPTASHTGGLWERQIRTVRVILCNMLNEQTITEDVLRTTMCLAEDLVNSRPLTQVSTDATDLSAITPNDILRPRAQTPLPIGIAEEKDKYRRKWRQAQYLADVFWRRWLSTYLPTLQLRSKWLKKTENLKVGDLVVLVDPAAPRARWPLARVVAVFPGSDGLVRSVEVQTAKGRYKRPVSKIVLIEAG